MWDNMELSRNASRMRELLVLGIMILIFFFWFFPITALASLLSYEEIKRTMPWLGRWIDANDQLRAVVQTVLPSIAMISLNALLPFIFEGIYKALSSISSYLKMHFRAYLLTRLPCTKLGRIFAHKEIFPLPPGQRRFYIPCC